MEGTLSKIDTTILDNIIVGRVEPYIYAFSTETVPNYLKVGDTSRSVRVRLDEWRKIFPNLIQQYEHSAQIDANTIFRDYAVHIFLEQEKGLERLLPHTIENLPYYSREFFKDATAEDVDAAIKDILQNALENSSKYPLYSPDRLPQTFTYARTENYTPRNNQQQAIDNFKAAVEAGRTNLLLYAVMRFGKSFTAMCCAKEINAHFVLIVSAKVDVEEEWKKTVESHKYFENYRFLNSESLKQNETVIADTLSDPNKKVALFLSLQDLQGDDIKEKHKEVFEHQIDLLIIDETHFGARGASYGKVLQAQNLNKAEIKKELKGVDGFETLDQVEDVTKELHSKIRLHLSGTPYRILMSDEFQKEDVIAFVQFTDIIDAQQQWNDEHLKEDDCDEWENPYYEFPQMIRFAFNPNESSRKKMEQMRKDGITYAFSELFRPLSITTQTDGSHRLFKHEAEILDLLEVIDGTKEDENLLGFLDYDKIKDGKMCRHMVCVLPFRASCDAMATLIQRNRDKFKNLSDYEIINIAGFDDERKYKSTDDVKREIRKLESRNKKTLTLTVNRMLTGTTVPQWDTMLYLKGTASPQEYDQAIFRLQNQYITTFKDESGKTIKYNMKPQTLLVDFDPNRMFVLQELKSQFYNVNTDVQGNSQLKERIAKELEISPIIVLNKNKLQQATPTNITDAVREYSRTRSILDDATEIPADNYLLQNDTVAAILRTIEPIDAKNGLQIKPTEGEGDDIDAPDVEEIDESDDSGQNGNISANTEQPKETVENDNFHKRLAAFYARILFFAFLTESTVKSLEDVIAMIPTNEDNCRIAHNLGLNIDILTLIQRKSNPFILQKFDYKIENVNDLMRDDGLTPIKRVETAMRKFGRMSDSEIVTPLNVADDVVKLLPKNVFSYGPVLDIASKQGEFTIALLKRYGKEVLDKIYSVCTSTLAYEFTRKVYKLLLLPIDHIFDTFTSYDLIKKDNNKKYIIPQGIINMKFAAIIGNPPYQVMDGGAGVSASPIYNSFVDSARTISPDFISMIMPAKWYSGGKGLDGFRVSMLNDYHISKIVDFIDSRDCFPTSDIAGGICFFLWDKHYNGKCHFKHNANGKIFTTIKALNNKTTLLRNPISEKIVEKVTGDETIFFDTIVSSRKPFGLATNAKIVNNGDLKIRHNKGLGFFNRTDVPNGIELIDKWNLIISYLSAEHAGQPDKNGQFKILSSLDILNPGTICTETYLVAFSSNNQTEAQNAYMYFQSKFLRFLVSVIAISQHITKNCFAYVPMQNFTNRSDIDWSKSIAEIDAQLYAKYHLSDEEISFIESIIKPM